MRRSVDSWMADRESGRGVEGHATCTNASRWLGFVSRPSLAGPLSCGDVAATGISGQGRADLTAIGSRTRARVLLGTKPPVKSAAGIKPGRPLSVSVHFLRDALFALALVLAYVTVYFWWSAVQDWWSEYRLGPYQLLFAACSISWGLAWAIAGQLLIVEPEDEAAPMRGTVGRRFQ